MPRRIGGNPSGVRWIAAGSRPREIVALIGRHGGRGAPVHASCPLRGAGCARCRGHRARRLRRHKCCAPARWASRRPAALAAQPHRPGPPQPSRPRRRGHRAQRPCPSPLCRPRARRRDARRHRWPAQGAPRRRAPARGLGARRQPRHRHLAAAGGRSAMRGLGPVGTVASDGRTLADQPREVRALFTAQWGPTQAA